MILNLSVLVYYFSQNYNVITEYLSALTVNEIAYLMDRYSYRMAILLKYGNSDAEFEDKLPISILEEDCYECGNQLPSSERYECLGLKDFSVEFICEKCHIKIKEDNK